MNCTYKVIYHLVIELIQNETIAFEFNGREFVPVSL